jgi:cytochrome P450
MNDTAVAGAHIVRYLQRHMGPLNRYTVLMLSPDDYNILDPELIQNPYGFFRALIAQAPVYQIPGTEVYLVSSRTLIEKVLRNHRDYSANLTGILVTGEDGTPEVFDFSEFGGSVDAIANADEPRHSEHRKLVLPQLNARKMDEMEPELRRWSGQRIKPLVDRGIGDWIAEVADPVPVLAMARLIGLPADDLQQFLVWAFSGGEILAGTTDLLRLVELSKSTAAMSEYLQDHLFRSLERNSAYPAVDVTDELVAGIRAGLISEREAISILIVLVGAAGESTASLTGSAVRLLAEDEKLQHTLREFPGLIPRFVEEVVRLESPFKGHYRVVTRATELGGQHLPDNARVLLLWAAANRDPAEYTLPDKADLARAKPREHLAYGQGMHFCVGARLARMEARVILEELLSSTAHFSIPEDFTPRYVASIFVRRLSELVLVLKPRLE